MRYFVLALSVGVAIVASLVLAIPDAAATDPCYSVSGDPDPENEPDPYIGGTVTEDANGDPPVVGATMELFKCVSGSSVSQGKDTTDSNGRYEFASLTAVAWYYVEAEMTGPLSGMSPVSPTTNPSSVVGLGPSATIDFEFGD